MVSFNLLPYRLHCVSFHWCSCMLKTRSVQTPNANESSCRDESSVIRRRLKSPSASVVNTWSVRTEISCKQIQPGISKVELKWFVDQHRMNLQQFWRSIHVLIKHSSVSASTANASRWWQDTVLWLSVVEAVKILHYK